MWLGQMFMIMYSACNFLCSGPVICICFLYKALSGKCHFVSVG